MNMKSPFSSENLRKNPKRFLTLLGLTVEQFDATYEKLCEIELKEQRQAHRLWSEKRVETLVNNRKPLLKIYLSITLLYLRQYNTQETIGTSFGTSQSEVSKIITKITNLLEDILPVPDKAAEKLLERIKEIPEEIREKYSATMIIDASEQRVERSQVQEKQKVEYSGKKSVTQGNFKFAKR